jgi:hypothetical protein
MPSARKQLVNRIENLTLGAFGNLQPSDTLNHLVRYLSTWSGSECVSSPFLSLRNEWESNETIVAASYSW